MTPQERQEGARRYERTLQQAYGAPILGPARPLFGATLLGLGPDGGASAVVEHMAAQA